MIRDEPIRHGLTMRDLDQATRWALARNVAAHAFSRAERYEIAWSAAALAVCEATEPPTVSDLASVAWQALAEARLTEMRHHGVDAFRYVGDQRPSFDRYWSWACRPAVSPEQAVVERVALYQVWPALTPAQQAALMALAVHGSVPLAADSMGVNRSTLHRAAWLGRQRFTELWHEGETPPARQGRDRRRADGQPVDPQAAAVANRRAARRRTAA